VGVHVVKAALVLAAAWLSLLVVAVGVGLWTGQVGAGLVVGGLVTAGVLLAGVDTRSRRRPAAPDRSDRRVPGL
jgi:hypothetical protein